MILNLVLCFKLSLLDLDFDSSPLKLDYFLCREISIRHHGSTVTTDGQPKGFNELFQFSAAIVFSSLTQLQPFSGNSKSKKIR